MKDTIITAKQKKNELFYFLICFILAFLINVYAIITRDSSWKEIFTQLHIVIGLAVAGYIIFFLIRFIWKKITNIKGS